MPQISKEQIEQQIALLNDYFVICTPDRDLSIGAALGALQALLDQPKDEPVAELLLSRSGHGIVVEWHKTMPAGTKLYTHPAPFTPITANDVTDEVVEVMACYRGYIPADKEIIAAAVNAYMKVKK